MIKYHVIDYKSGAPIDGLTFGTEIETGYHRDKLLKAKVNAPIGEAPYNWLLLVEISKEDTHQG